MAFQFVDVYNLEMAPKRKKNERQTGLVTQSEIAATNRLYQRVTDSTNALNTAKADCEARIALNNVKLGSLNNAKNNVLASRNILESEIDDAKNITNQRACNDEIQTVSTNVDDDLITALSALNTSSCGTSPFSSIDGDIATTKSTISGLIDDIDTDMDNFHSSLTTSSEVSTFSGGIDLIESGIGGGDSLSTASGAIVSLIGSMAGDAETAQAKTELEGILTNIQNGTITDTGTLSGEINTLQEAFGAELNSLITDIDGVKSSISSTSDTGDVNPVLTSLSAASSALTGTSYMAEFQSQVNSQITTTTNDKNAIQNVVSSLKTTTNNTFDTLQESRLKEIISKEVTKSGVFATFDKLKNSKDPFDTIDSDIMDLYRNGNEQTFADLVGYTGSLELLNNPPTLNGEIQKGGLDKQIDDINSRISEIQNEDCESVIAAKEAQLATLEFALIKSLIADNEAVNGKRANVNANSAAAKFAIARRINPNLSVVAFMENEFRSNPDLVDRAQNQISRLSIKADRFRDIVEGRPDEDAIQRELRNAYSIIDPRSCGLLALDEEGNILSEDKFNLPFQYISELKESKSANYEESHPIGRFESHRSYSGSGPMIITADIGYMAFASGVNSDEGFVQEMKDRWLAAMFPIYGKNHRSGVRSYGAPNKYLLNCFDRYVNIPVIIKEVSFENAGGMDPVTWYTMGFKMSISLETSYRLAQVVSADDVVSRGVRAFAHKTF